MLTATVITGLLLAGLIAVVGTNLSLGLEDDIKEQSVPLMANRLGIVIYSVDSFDKAETEIDLLHEYRIMDNFEDGNVGIGYNDNVDEVNTPLPSYNADLSRENVDTRYVCITVEENQRPTLRDGRCD